MPKSDAGANKKTKTDRRPRDYEREQTIEFVVKVKTFGKPRKCRDDIGHTLARICHHAFAESEVTLLRGKERIFTYDAKETEFSGAADLTEDDLDGSTDAG